MRPGREDGIYQLMQTKDIRLADKLTCPSAVLVRSGVDPAKEKGAKLTWCAAYSWTTSLAGSLDVVLA